MHQKTKETNFDFRTPLQIERDKRDKKIYIRYVKIEKIAINVSSYALCRVVGKEFNISPYAVRNSVDRYSKKLNPEQHKSETKQTPLTYLQYNTKYPSKTKEHFSL